MKKKKHNYIAGQSVSVCADMCADVRAGMCVDMRIDVCQQPREGRRQPLGDEDIGSVHDVTGFLILGVTCVWLMCLLPIFNYSPEIPSAFLDEESGEQAEGAGTSNQ